MAERDGCAIPSEVQRLFLTEQDKLRQRDEWRRFCDAERSLLAAIDVLPFDPRFNAVLWVLDAAGLCRQIAYSRLWMTAYAEHYKATVPMGERLSDTQFHVQYFADNAIVMTYACRDKVALAVWAYYVPFNPEEPEDVLDYRAIMERLNHPARFGIRLRRVEPFLDCLEHLGTQEFTVVKRYRHLKVHRREPRIEIRRVAPHHGGDYLLPCDGAAEEGRLDDTLAEAYPDAESRAAVRLGCVVNGILYNRRRLKDAIWYYGDVAGVTCRCLRALLQASSQCMAVLRRRAPIRHQSGPIDAL